MRPSPETPADDDWPAPSDEPAPTEFTREELAVDGLPPEHTIDFDATAPQHSDVIRVGLPHRLDLCAAVEGHVDAQHDDTAGSETYIDRVPTPTGEAHPDAIGNPVDVNPTAEPPEGGLLTPPVEGSPPHVDDRLTSSHALVEGGPRLPRDRVALLEIVRYRVLSFRQLQARVFGTLHKSVLTRRVHALKRAGFIETWEEHLVIGGHPHYALPTKRGLAWAFKELTAEAQGRPHETLVRNMIGEARKRPLLLERRTAPGFLPHQDETNRVVAALEAIPALGITWASTWHRPFPNKIDHIPMPQPDAVLVATRDGKPHLVFLEHDRGHEALASFASAKAERYAALALYGLTEELFGFDDFTVWVTINDVAEQHPLRRMRRLQSVSQDAGMLRFTLAGWIPSYAHERPIWFTPTTEITARELRPEAHEGLADPFAPPQSPTSLDPTAELLRRIRASTRDVKRDGDLPFAP